MNRSEYKLDTTVVIIGAGLSGLYAAMELEKAGIDCQVIEAQNMIGGRIRTIDIDGQKIDIGGTGLGPSHRRAHEMVEKFGLKPVQMTRRGELAFSINGSLLGADKWPLHRANKTVGKERDILPSRIDSYFMQELLPFDDPAGWKDPANAKYDISFADHMRARNVSPEAMRLVNMCINANDIETVSALTVFRDAIKWRAVGYNDPKNFDQYRDALYKPVKLEGGMIQIPIAMANSLKKDVLLGKKVTRIEQFKGYVRVHCGDGEIITSARAIVSVPIMALRSIEFDPPLPSPLDQAVAKAESSGNTQFILSSKSRFWEEDGFGPSLWSDTLFERMFVEFRENDSVHHIRVWVNGDNASRVDQMGDRGGDAMLETMERIRPSTKGQLDILHHVSWGAEDLIQGEKYVMAPGQVCRFAKHLATPHGNIHWAGDHHKDQEVGIEAALESGERAARELLAALPVNH